MMIKRVLASIAVMAAVLLGNLASSAPAQAAEACEPTSGLAACVQFQFTGGDQAFVVPSGVAQLEVRLWGAGGGE